MRIWLMYIAIIAIALAALLTVAHSFPGASPTVLYVGTPILVTGAGLGAKSVKEHLPVRNTHQH